MLLGPIFHSELITSSRRARYFVLRSLYASMLLLSLLSSYSGLSREEVNLQVVAELAASFFIGFAWLQLLLVMLIGPALAASSIAIERERRTIEYLFATDLSNFEVVFGKLFAKLLQIGALVLVGLPILAMFRLLGGISADLLAAVFAVTLSSMLFVTVVGITISVWAPRPRDAVTRTYLFLAALWFLPLFLISFWPQIFLSSNHASPLVSVNEMLLNLNPMWLLTKILIRHGLTGPISIWDQVTQLVLYQTLFSVIGAAVSLGFVRRAYLQSVDQVPKRRKQHRRAQSWFEIGNRPMLWKEMFSRHSGIKLGLVGRISSLLLLLMFISWNGLAFYYALSADSPWGTPYDRYIETAYPLCIFLSCCLILVVGSRAASAITSEKERDCWISLISTPLGAFEIVSAKIWGNLYSVRWLLLLLAVALGGTLLFDVQKSSAVLWWLFVFFSLMLFASTLGVTFSLCCSTSVRAMGATLGTLLFLGGGYLFCCMPVTYLQDDKLFLSPCIPFLLSSLLDDSLEMEETRYVGMTLYWIVTGILMGFVTLEFDRLAGRTTATQSSPPAHPSSKPISDSSAERLASEQPRAASPPESA